MADAPATPPAPSNPNPPATDPNNPNPAPPAPGSSPSNDAVPTTWEDVFKHPRFKQLNDKASEAEKKLQEQEKQKQEEERQRQIKAGEHQKVIDDLTPKAKRAEELEAALVSVVDAEMQQIPEARRSLVPDLPPEKKLDYIVKNRAFLMDGKKGNVNTPTNPAGGSPSGDDKTIFTLAQIQDPEFYGKNRDAILKAQREGRVRD